MGKVQGTSAAVAEHKHYQLEVQANPKKIVQKNDAIFSIYGRNEIIP